MCFNGVMETTPNPQYRPEPHGTLTPGATTHLGTIDRVSDTAYLIDGRWVPFLTIHGPYTPADPLVRFG